jgi:glucosamine-6-phosphate deaminase
VIGVQVRVFPTSRAAGAPAAAAVVAALRASPAVTLGLPTGRTPIPLYQDLVRRHARGEADFSAATTFNLDEFLGLPASHPGSYRSFMERHLFGRVNLDPTRIHMLDGTAADPAAECVRYEAAIQASGGIDLQLLGIGTNGHIGFNEPGRTLEARTHRVRLKAETRRANAALFGGRLEDVPREALSMGIATILQARAIVMLATGRSKARCVAGVVRGPLTTRLPASFLQLHPAVTLLLDEAAAAGVKI